MALIWLVRDEGAIVLPLMIILPPPRLKVGPSVKIGNGGALFTGSWHKGLEYRDQNLCGRLSVNICAYLSTHTKPGLQCSSSLCWVFVRQELIVFSSSFSSFPFLSLLSTSLWASGGDPSVLTFEDSLAAVRCWVNILDTGVILCVDIVLVTADTGGLQAGGLGTWTRFRW